MLKIMSKRAHVSLLSLSALISAPAHAQSDPLLLSMPVSATSAKSVDEQFQEALHGCAPHLQRTQTADQAARALLSGKNLREATDQYAPSWSSWGGILPGGSIGAVILKENLRNNCANIKEHQFYGLYNNGQSAALITMMNKTPELGSQAKEGEALLIASNIARSKGAQCGNEYFKPAGPLSWHPGLATVATAYAQHQAQYNFTGHNDKFTGAGPGDRLKAINYIGAYGENLAYGTRSAQATVQAWIESPGHCKNLMNPKMRFMGSGYALNSQSNFGVYWGQLLGY